MKTQKRLFTRLPPLASLAAIAACAGTRPVKLDAPGIDGGAEERLEAFQASLIEEEITGSNMALVFQDGEVTYRHVENSGKEGDRDITDETLFPIWSMSKPITIVAMLTLH